MIEVIRRGASAANAKVVIFDFDGTLSLIRSGWIDVMIPLCVGELTALRTGESQSELTKVAEEFIWRLTGKETIYQMAALAEAIRERGGKPEEPSVYKKRYLAALWEKIRDRVEGLREGRFSPDHFLVPGALQLLQSLRDRELRLYLASGTDDANVKEEAALLGVAPFFGDRIYGARDDLNSFSKALLVKQIVTQMNGFRADGLLVFGDGYVEIEEVKRVGGLAVGVATSEPACETVDPWKRARLIEVGADFIVPNFLHLKELSSALFHSNEI